MAKKNIEQVSEEQEKLYNDVRTAKPSHIKWGKVNFKIGWMKPYALERISDVQLNCKKDSEVPYRCAALVLLNGLFSIFFLYWIVWRALYHFVPSNVILAIIEEGKKRGIAGTGLLDIYHINDRDEGYEDEYDKEGDRAFSSRTTFGEAWTIGEKHPNLVASKSFLFGLITIQMYEYRCLYSLAQIELLMSDKPVILYKSMKDKGKKKFKRPNMVGVVDKSEEWAEKYKNGVSKKIDLTGFLKK